MSNFDWNYRIVCDGTISDEDGITIGGVFEVREVHYKDGKPIGHGRPFVIGDSPADLRSTNERMQEAFNSPVLYEKDFPSSHSVTSAEYDAAD